MPVYLFVWQALAWSVTAVILFPLTIPWSVLAYKIWHGFKEIEEDMAEELWARAWRVNLVLLVTTPLFIVVDYFVTDMFDLPAGWVHAIFLGLLICFIAWMMMFFFSMEDFLQGLLLTTIYVYVPVTLMFVVSLFLANPLFNYILSWLIKPTER